MNKEIPYGMAFAKQEVISLVEFNMLFSSCFFMFFIMEES